MFVDSKRHKKRILIVAVALTYFGSVFYIIPVSATSDFIKENAYVYNPQSITANVATCLPSGSVISESNTIPSALPTLPLSTIGKLESAKIKELATQNMAAYLEGEKASGVPWAVLAAVHYREASMNPKKSIANGQSITGSVYTSIDGQKIGATLIEDARVAGIAFKEKAKMVYKIDISKDSSAIDLGNAFLAYNRGFMYKNWGKTYIDSPYVMTGYDAGKLSMKWIEADSYVSPGKQKKLNSLYGKTESRPGAMAVYTFLGGTAGLGGSANCKDSSVVSGDIVSTGKALAHATPVQGKQGSPWSSKSKPEFVEAVKKYNPGPVSSLKEAAYADCGVYVSTVMRASGVDPKFPPSGTSIQKKYLEDNPDKYRINKSPTLSSVVPGDILLVVNNSDHHVTIYAGPIGESGGKKLMMLDASQEQRVPSYRSSGDLNWMLGRSGVFSATFIGGKAAPDAP